MQVHAQIPNLVNIYWIVYIKDNAFATLYDVYLRNFDVNDRQRKEYSVLWFRQIWRTLNDLAGRNHPLTLALEDIENAYNPLMPPYGNIQFEAKVIYSRSDGKYYYILIIDNFNYTLPYFDNYGGKKVIIESKQQNTMNNTKTRIRLTESQLHQVITESVKQILRENNWQNGSIYTPDLEGVQNNGQNVDRTCFDNDSRRLYKVRQGNVAGEENLPIHKQSPYRNFHTIRASKNGGINGLSYMKCGYGGQNGGNFESIIDELSQYLGATPEEVKQRLGLS